MKNNHQVKLILLGILALGLLIPPNSTKAQDSGLASGFQQYFVPGSSEFVASTIAGLSEEHFFNAEPDANPVEFDNSTDERFTDEDTGKEFNNNLNVDLLRPGIVQIYGHLYIDSNGNGSQEQGEPDLADVNVIVTDINGITQTVASDLNGDWSATVPVGSTTADVDENDPDYPTGYTQTEGDDPTTVTTIAGQDTDAGIDGFYMPNQLDLAVDKTVYNAVPQLGGESVFTITVTNLSPDITATNVEIEDILDANLVYKYSSPSSGSYDENTGIWSIPFILPGQTANLDIVVTVNGSADNMARLLDLDQDDTNIKNDYGYASVSVNGSSGGNDGGIESDGSLAEKIAVRHFSRLKDPSVERLQAPMQMISFNENLAADGIIRPVSIMKGDTDLAELFPQDGPFKSTAFVSTPSDIIGISNAKEVFSVDYFDSDDRRMAAILAMTTDNGEVYNHTKMVCDRLNGASLDLLDAVLIRNQQFILGKLVQDNGDIDYTISFIAYEENGRMLVDNRWENQDYDPADGAVFNFQVWSVTPQSTIQLVESILNRLEKEHELMFITAARAEVPDIYVLNGYYENGAVYINLFTGTEIDQITVTGKLTRTETSITEPFETVVPITSTQGGYQTIEIPTGYVYDIDFRLSNSVNDSRDVLYFADGTWGKYIEESAAIVDRFETTEHNGIQRSDAYTLERNAIMSGQVRTYASLFRSLRPGNLSVDLTGYNTLEFDAGGFGEVELIVAKASIDNWNEQYRTVITFEPREKTYQIDLSTLTSSLQVPFSSDDIVSVSFNALGDGQSFRDFEMEIKEMRFLKGSSNHGITDSDMLNMNVYPNPVQYNASIDFMLPEDGQVRIALYDITGKEIMEVANSGFGQGHNTVRFDTHNTENGVYFFKIFWNNQVETKRISVIR